MSLVINTDPKVYDGAWKEFQSGVNALIRPYTRQMVRKVMALATVSGPPAAEGIPPTESHVDPLLWDKHLYREIIGDISGLIDPDKKPVEINKSEPDTDGVVRTLRNVAAIDAVCDQVDGFAAWALAESKALAAAITATREAQTKNLKRSHGGKQTGQKD